MYADWDGGGTVWNGHEGNPRNHHNVFSNGKHIGGWCGIWWQLQGQQYHDIREQGGADVSFHATLCQ